MLTKKKMWVFPIAKDTLISFLPPTLKWVTWETNFPQSLPNRLVWFIKTRHYPGSNPKHIVAWLKTNLCLTHFGFIHDVLWCEVYLRIKLSLMSNLCENNCLWYIKKNMHIHFTGLKWSWMLQKKFVRVIEMVNGFQCFQKICLLAKIR